jgi:hypothetical protein
MAMLFHALALLAVLLVAAPPTIVHAAAPQGATHAASNTIRVGPQHALTRVADAARIARDGDVVEIEAAVYTDDVAAWHQSNITIRGVGGRARMVSKGRAAEGKAIWVIKGDNVTIENIEFAGTRVPSRNGAGIRHEGGRLTVRNCLFEHNEMGILTWNNKAAELEVEYSEFRHNAGEEAHKRTDPGHQIYVGTIRRFSLRGSYVHRGAFGHLVKTRASENHIYYNRLTDEEGGRASYELEFPSGGVAYVIGNIIQQSPGTDNPHLISFGVEGYRWPRNELYLVNNTLIDELPQGGIWLRVSPGADRVKAVNNLLLGGKEELDLEDLWHSEANHAARSADFVKAAARDYRLRRNSSLVGKSVDPGEANGVQLKPDREYVHPLRTGPLPRGPYNPGALQSVR